MLTSRPALALRSVLRTLGITRLVARLKDRAVDRQMRELTRDYAQRRPQTAVATVGTQSIQLKVDDEHEFARAATYVKDMHLLGPLLDAVAAVPAGAVVWDVGSNFGLYGLLAAKVPQTQVVLFDPDPWCVRRLHENVALNGAANVRIVDAALSETTGAMRFEPAGDSVGGTSHLVDARPANTETIAATVDNTVEVQVVPGDELRAQQNLPVPNVIKIDVEGFEGEVLRGLRRTLADPGCRYVLVEVHFGLLARRGLNRAPDEIVKLFRDSGFTDTAWPDASHLVARKKPSVSR